MIDLRPFRSRGFTHLAAATWVNEFGNWIGEIALAILVFDRTRSPLATATLFLSLRFLPAVLAPAVATRLEVLPTRFILGALYLTEAALFAGLSLLTVHFSLPLVLALAACDGVLAISSTALSRSALVNSLTADGLLREGNALVNLGTMIAIAGAPAIAGVVVATNGAAAALRVDAATFVVTALIILTARGLSISFDPEAGFRERLRGGLGVLRTRPTVRRLLIAISLVVTMGSVALPIEVVFAKQTLHAGDSGYGILLTAWGAGMIVGGFVFATGRELRLMSVLGFSVLLIAIGYGGLAAAPTLAVACVFSCVGGAGNSAAWVAAKTAMQERIPMTAQSPVMAVLEACNQVMPALGFMIGGVITALSSPRAAYALSALGVAAVLAFFAIRPIDRVELSTAATSTADNSPNEPIALQESGSPARTPTMPTPHTR